MKIPWVVLTLAGLCLAAGRVESAPAAVVVFSETGFPAADSAAPPAARLRSLFPDAELATVEALRKRLSAPGVDLLVLPYGSAFPEEAWTETLAYLRAGGHLLVLGGRPFTRSAYRDHTGWHLRDYSVRFTRALQIDQYQETPGSDGLSFETPPDLTPRLPRFSWKRAWSPILRLSAVEHPYPRGGGAGAIDARLDALAWGLAQGRRLAAPALQIDHLRNAFVGGRWIFVLADLSPRFYEESADVIRPLADRARQGSEELTARPVFPLFLPGEPVPLEIHWQSARPLRAPVTVDITVFPETEPSRRTKVRIPFPADRTTTLPAPTTPGLHVIETRLRERGTVRAVYRSGFWIRSEALLRSGPRLSVNADYFELDGKPMAVAGTTYMASDVQRLFFDHPNVYVWDRDMRDIRGAGLNMLRTGWWTGWNRFYDENGVPHERTYRTLEAYLLTARKHDLPVQWTFFAFVPEAEGGVNPYLDAEAVRRQRTLVSSLAARFHDVPGLAWDFINEPSISKRLWLTRPHGDAVELGKWNDWLGRRYPDRAALAALWNVPASAVEGAVPLPEDVEFEARGVYSARNSLKVYDFFVFAQEVFVDWVKTMRDAVRATGSRQLVTVGQDEGGVQDRLSPAYWGEEVDFTTNHSWWQNDHLLWDSVLAKQPGRPLLIQETGLQRELHLDEVTRRDPLAEAQLLERKLAASFMHGAGAIEWLWNINSYMTSSNETPIGLVRADATEKPEAAVMRAFATFAQALGPHLKNPERPPVALITSQAAQFSAIGDVQLQAQKAAVRALAYGARLPLYAVAENQIAKLGSPALALLPSPQALTETAWQALLAYVSGGGRLLVTGAVDRDEHWHAVSRVAEIVSGARTEPLLFHDATLRMASHDAPLTFDQQKQGVLEWVRFPEGATFATLAYGKGRIDWAAHPVELADGERPAAELYTFVAEQAGVRPRFDLRAPLSPGVLVYPIAHEDGVLYVMISDAAEDAAIDLEDRETGVHLALRLPAQRAALAFISALEKTVVARYGF